MNIFKRFITVICLTAFLICLSGIVKAKADAIEASEVISNVVSGADLTSISYAYNNLSLQQKYIANYLLGAFNYVYLCARGFRFDIDLTETNMKAQLGAIGERIWQYVTTAYGWRSRFNEVFRQYASSIIIYAAKQNSTFDTWINDILNGDRKVFIEYTEDAFDAWTVFYNDPSGDGIASFGQSVSDWNSGVRYDFWLDSPRWNSNADQNRYNDFILNHSPVLYTNVFDQTSTKKTQGMIGYDNNRVIDSLFIQRGSSYSYFTYGYSDLTKVPANTSFNVIEITYEWLNLYGGAWFVRTGTASTTTARSGNLYYATNSLSDLIDHAFQMTTFAYYDSRYSGYYYLFDHVYLVDDINTLSNPEEIFNVQGFDIVPPSSLGDFIITPNGKMLIPGLAPIEDPFEELWDVSVDINNEPVTEDDFSTQIVNNTVINNYIVDDTDKINVPVEWFDNDYTDKLDYDAQPFFTFVRDCIQSTGDLQIYFYGALVIGLGGGILKKFLL